VRPWVNLVNTYEQKLQQPEPPKIHERLWAPSGMENLHDAFKWAIKETKGEASELWKFYYGTWLAGRGEIERAIETLVDCKPGVAQALLARLYKINHNNEAALKAFQAIEEPWLQLHPQVVVERDKVLRSAGPHTITLREEWLNRVNALEDEWVIERRIQLLIDKGQFAQAKELLLSVPFQKVHQTYTRTNLWKQICEKLKEPCEPIPQSLGEDRLATFGAYREFE
jgi:hypothetical protein